MSVAGGEADLLAVDIGVIGDQARGAPDLAHDGVAGIDAQAALNAAELNSVANIDPGGADTH